MAETTPRRSSSSPIPGVVRGVGPETVHDYGSKYHPYLRRRLAELCVVALVFGLIFYLLIPTLAGTAESARRATCTANLRRLAQIAAMYLSDYDAYPPTENWVRAIYPMLTGGDGTDRSSWRELLPGSKISPELTDTGGAALLFCPSEENLPRPVRKYNWVNSSYSYRNPSASGVVLDESGTPVFWDYLGGSGVGAHPDGGNVAYLDGHVKWVPHDRWRNSDLP